MELETQSIMRREQKRRGRPRKVLDVNPSTNKSRARARESQTVFRSRRKAAVEKLDRRTIFLENVIEAMSNEFMALGEYVTQNTCYNNQSKVLVEMKERTQKFLTIARSVEPNLLGGSTPRSPTPLAQSSLHHSVNSNSPPTDRVLLETDHDTLLHTATLIPDAGNNSSDLTVAKFGIVSQTTDSALHQRS